MFRSDKILKSVLGFVVLVSLVSCGGASNNDQGVSFLATGYFKRPVGGGELTPSSGSVANLFSDTSATGSDGLFVEISMGIQNNLTKQFIRVVRIDCDYDVAGSFIKIPSESFPESAVLVSATPPTTTSTSTTAGETTTITSTSSDFTSSSQIAFLVLTPDLYSFINNNKASFPELPFRMTAVCSATGVTQAGDVMTTNPLNYFIQFVEDAEEGAGTGPGVGVGTGGTLVTTGSTSALIPDSSSTSDTSLTSLDTNTVNSSQIAQ